MTPQAASVLTATGYLSRDGQAAEGLVIAGGTGAAADVPRTGPDAARIEPLMSTRPGHLGADAIFRVGTTPVVVFKSSDQGSGEEADWHRIAWNAGAAPLLWVTTPQYVRLYNAYQPPSSYTGQSPLLREFRLAGSLDTALAELAEACGRRHIAMGGFWKSDLARPIDRRGRIDGVLLAELSQLLQALVGGGLSPTLAQKLVGRCIFVQYLVHRGNIQPDELARRYGAGELHEILTDLDATYRLFRWVKETFNGDLFPLESPQQERQQLGDDIDRLAPLAAFFGRFNVRDGQGRLFPFRFDAIPIELISSIYEKFVHLAETDGSPRTGVHYTPINLVDLVLDPVFEGLSPDARILDPACGSAVFLVEGLRRLVWLKAGGASPTRDLIRRTLFEQVRGVDVSPAALSIAAFSLYLTLLELDPDAPRGMDEMEVLKFDHLRGRVLFQASAFDAALPGQLSAADRGGHSKFDAIVGNPPWTYVSNAAAAQADRGEDDVDEDDVERIGDETESPARMRTGAEYARDSVLPVPRRSPDWPFLWRARDFAGPETRIALIMKATPFFSLDQATGKARELALRSFPNVTLLNLSQLRTSRLFQEFPVDEEEGAKPKTAKDCKKNPAAGPALVFFSNCLPTEPGASAVTTINMPWSESFRRTGVFELSADPPRSVALDLLASSPSLLKTAMFGTERDVWFLDRLSRNPSSCRLGDWCRELSLPMGRGYQRGDTMPSGHLMGLPRVEAGDLTYASIRERLPRMEEQHVHRAREPAIFKGPLVLLPEGRLADAPKTGRYTAGYDPRDLAYNASFVGVSFHGLPTRLARAFAGVMHSALVGYQIAMLGGTVGVKQTKVEAVDLQAVRIPRLDNLTDAELETLADAADVLRAGDRDGVPASLAVIDRTMADALRLGTADRALLWDSDRRSKAIIFETPSARAPMRARPTQAELERYSDNVCLTFNAFAVEDDDLVLVPDRHQTVQDGLLVMKFGLRERAAPQQGILVSASIDELGSAPLERLGSGGLPYLRPSESLRLYVGSSVYVLKPAQYQYFTPAAGQSDGDRMIGDVMVAGPGGGDECP